MSALPTATPVPLLRAIVLVALAYAISGRLGLLLAIPPGYATAVWPASGVALASTLLWGYRVWPGILIGSFLVNISTSWDASSAAQIVRSLLLAGAIGAGAALQATVGAWAVRRWTRFRNIFQGEAEIIRVLLLGGPLGCVVNATVSVGALWFAGLIPQPNLLFNWWTWWVGDSIGVLIFTPLVCAWSLRPPAQWRRQQIALSVPMGVVFAAVVALFFYVSAGEQRRLYASFDARAAYFGAELQEAVDTNLQMLTALNSLYAASDTVDRAEFESFVSHMLPQYPAVQVVAWAPQIRAARLPDFEQQMRDAGHPQYRVYDTDAQGHAVEPAARDTYLPVAYIVPGGGNQRVLGYDVTSEPTRRDAVQRALRSGTASASAWIHLVQDETHRLSTILYLPLHGKAPDTLGVASAVLRLDTLLRTAFADMHDQGLHARVYDGQDITSARVFAIDATELPAHKIARQISIPVRVADRVWAAQFLLPADHLVANRSWQAWGLLAAGLLLTALLGILLLVLLARQARVEELVNSRTSELREAQQRLVGKAADLERSNRELEQFASVASHDLQAPVRGVLSFAQLLRQRYAGKVLEGKGVDFLQHIEQSAVHMKALIDGLLALSRIGRQEQHENVDCEKLLAEVETQIAGIVHERQARISHRPLPVVHGSRLEIFQVFQNLIVNGLKFQPGDSPRIEIGAEHEGAMWRLSVRDHGIGIAPQHQERIFRIFQRLHSTAYEGTGIGLAICEKIVTGHGGRIWVESTPGAGAVFHFTLPAATRT